MKSITEQVRAMMAGELSPFSKQLEQATVVSATPSSLWQVFAGQAKTLYGHGGVKKALAEAIILWLKAHWEN